MKKILLILLSLGFLSGTNASSAIWKVVCKKAPSGPDIGSDRLREKWEGPDDTDQPREEAKDFCKRKGYPRLFSITKQSW